MEENQRKVEFTNIDRFGGSDVDSEEKGILTSVVPQSKKRTVLSLDPEIIFVPSGVTQTERTV